MSSKPPEVYIYVRDEYPARARSSRARSPSSRPAVPTLHLRRGAGAYICGEESSLLESIEGKRGLPRHKPPYPFQVGLFGRPTLINNVETLYLVRDIVEKGTEWWTSARPQRAHGTSLLLGVRPRARARRQARAGRHHRARTDRGILRRHGGRPHVFAPTCPAALRAGSCRHRWRTSRSTSARWKSMAASSGRPRSWCLSDKDDVRAAALNLMRFFEDESCGQCTPCRVGTEKARKLMEWPRLGSAAPRPSSSTSDA